LGLGRLLVPPKHRPFGVDLTARSLVLHLHDDEGKIEKKQVNKNIRRESTEAQHLNSFVHSFANILL
jgi:hypothetical protein